MNMKGMLAAACLFAWLIAAVLVVLIPAFPAFADVLKECDFETNLCGSEWQNYPGERDTFGNFVIIPLLGGGNYCIALKAKSDTPPGSKINWNYAASSEIYIRYYLYFPSGYIASGDFGGTLKLMRHSHPIYSEDSDLKLGMENGVLKLQQRAFYKPYTGANYSGAKIPSDGLSFDRWHYIECHYKHENGNDLLQIWVDSDARTSPPTWSESNINVYDYDFSRVTFNINWGAGNAPATQQFYMDGLVISTEPVGDTYNLLEDTTPPAVPTRVNASAP